MKISYRGLTLEFSGVPSAADLEAAYQAKTQSLKLASEAAKASIPVRPDAEEAPLASTQFSLWFEQSVNPESLKFLFPRVLRLRGPLDAEALRRSVEALVERHEVLRTIIPTREGSPYQKVLPAGTPVPWHFLDVSHEARPEASARQGIDAACREPFNLAVETPLRVYLWKVSATEHLLLLLFHHICTDPWSDLIVRQELFATYQDLLEGGRTELPALSVQYGDYAAWEVAQKETPAFEEGLKWWDEYLPEHEGAVVWPTATDADEETRPLAGTHHFEWSEEIAVGLQQVADAAGATYFEALLCGFMGFVANETATPDLTIGTLATTRRTLELQRLVGFFPNVLALRSNPEPGESFASWLARFHDSWRRSLRHQWIPFQDLLAERRRVGRGPVNTDIFFVYQHELAQATQTAHVAGLEMEFVDRDQVEAESVMQFQMSSSDGKPGGFVRYDSRRFTPRAMEDLVGRFEQFVRTCAANPDQPVWGIETQSSEALSRQRERARGPTVDARGLLLPEQIVAQVRRAPERHAISSDALHWTYGELLARSSGIAAALAERGVGPEVVVGVCMQRSPELIATLLGIVLAGGAYVSLEPGLPAQRLKFMAEDAAAALVVCDESGLQAAPWTAPTVEFASQLRDRTANEVPAVELDPENLAYILYTSGSTGQPKGVEMRHGAVANLLQALDHHQLFEPDDVVLAKTPYGFDVSVSEMFNTLVCGARLVMTRAGEEADADRIAELVQREGVTVLRMVPTALEMFTYARDFPRCTTLRRVICAGEALTQVAATRLFQHHGDVELFNLLGATETCVDTTFERCSRELDKPVSSVGVPLPNYSTYVLDPTLRFAIDGAAGELYVGGRSLARGYRSLARRTATSFLPDPFAAEPGSRMYRTGDVVRWDSFGMDYLGRADSQLQVRGVRVELLEVEGRLQALPGVRQAVVVAVGEHAGHADSLCAYLVFDPGQERSAAALRDELAQSLPEAAIPTQFVTMDSLPRTASEKIDRNALPRPQAGAVPQELLSAVELEELERVLRSLPPVSDAAVKVVQSPSGQLQIVAYVVPQERRNG